jgi:hypothetical protein
MSAATVQQPDSPDTINRWRQGIAFVGGLAIVFAATFELVALVSHQVTSVVVTGKMPDLTTTTTTGPSGPSSAIIGGLFAGGALLLLLAAFFTRITKIVLPGGAELDVDNGSQLAGAIAAVTQDPATGARLFKRVAPTAAQKITQKKSATHVAASTQLAWDTNPLLSSQEAKELVNAAKIEDEAEKGHKNSSLRARRDCQCQVVILESRSGRIVMSLLPLAPAMHGHSGRLERAQVCRLWGARSLRGL